MSKVSEQLSKRTKKSTPAESPEVKLKNHKVKVALTKAAEKAQANVGQAIATIKQTVTESLEAVANAVAGELNDLAQIQLAIKAKSEELETLYDIQDSADVLSDLIDELDALKEQEKAFIADRDAKRAKDEEEYQYQLKKTHRENKDRLEAELEEKRLEVEDALNDREEQLETREALVQKAVDECASIRAEVVELQSKQKAEVDRAVAIATNSLKKDLENEHALDLKDKENTIALQGAKIASLEVRVAELVKANSEYDAKYKEATKQVQDIAQKAIEGASKHQTVFQVPQQDSRK